MQKSSKVKGFTLIELIIVMATFSIIMFGALKLLQPTRRMFDRSYSQESMLSGALLVSDYLEDTLRYANNVQIMDSQPTKKQLEDFITAHYDGHLVSDKTDPTKMVAANGSVYVLHIDNAKGGLIEKAEYAYTAGDQYEKDLSGKTVGPTITPDAPKASDYHSSINQALYNDYLYNISLGAYVLDYPEISDGLGGTKKADYLALALDSDFYGFYNNTSMQSFGQGNFGFTITAYPVPKKGVPFRTGDATSGYHYTDGTAFSSSVKFENMNSKIGVGSIIYKRDSSTHAKITEKDKDGNEVKVGGKPVYLYDVDKFDEATSTPRFANSMGAAAEPDDIYIIYTYVEREVVKK